MPVRKMTLKNMKRFILLMAIIYRSLKNSELPKAQALETEVWPGYRLPEHRWSLDDMQRCFPIIGAFERGRLVGALCAMPMSNGFYWIHSLFVDNGYRNKHIGTRLVETLFSKIRKKAKGARTEIKKGDAEVFDFYSRLGFRKRPNTEYVDFWKERYFEMEKKF